MVRLGFSHAAILVVAAIAFFLGIEWLYLALGVLFLALIVAEYAAQPAPKPVPPPPPAPPPGAQQPIIIQAQGGPADMVNTFLANLLTGYTEQYKYMPFVDLEKYPQYKGTHAYKESERLRKEIAADMKDVIKKAIKKELAASKK